VNHFQVLLVFQVDPKSSDSMIINYITHKIADVTFKKKDVASQSVVNDYEAKFTHYSQVN
jgi:hypothetical protein